MTQMQVLTDWSHIAAGVAFWTCLLWPALVRFIWPWWQSAWGWNMVVKVELIALALLGGVLHNEFGVPVGFALLWTVVIAVTLIPLAIAWRTWIIWRAQRDGAAQDRQLGKAAEIAGAPGKLGAFFVFPEACRSAAGRCCCCGGRRGGGST